MRSVRGYRGLLGEALDEIRGTGVARVESEHFAGESFGFFGAMKAQRSLGAEEEGLDAIAQDKVVVEEEHAWK